MELQEAALVSENSLEAELSLLEKEYFEGRESHAEDESSGMSSDNDGDPDRRSPPNTWTTEIRELKKRKRMCGSSAKLPAAALRSKTPRVVATSRKLS